MVAIIRNMDEIDDGICIYDEGERCNRPGKDYTLHHLGKDLIATLCDEHYNATLQIIQRGIEKRKAKAGETN